VNNTWYVMVGLTPQFFQDRNKLIIQTEPWSVKAEATLY